MHAYCLLLAACAARRVRRRRRHGSGTCSRHPALIPVLRQFTNAPAPDNRPSDHSAKTKHAPWHPASARVSRQLRRIHGVSTPRVIHRTVAPRGGSETCLTQVKMARQPCLAAELPSQSYRRRCPSRHPSSSHSPPSNLVCDVEPETVNFRLPRRHHRPSARCCAHKLEPNPVASHLKPSRKSTHHRLIHRSRLLVSHMRPVTPFQLRFQWSQRPSKV